MIELTTQCPQCQHRFDMSLAQMQQRKGLSRCPQCAHIFDAYECAVVSAKAAETEPSEPLMPAAPTVAPTPKPVQKVAPPVSHLRRHFIGNLPLDLGHSVHVFLTTEDAPRAHARVATPQTETIAPTHRGVIWLVVFWLFVLGVLLQSMYVYRVQIANTVAATRPALQRMCEVLGCEVPYTRQINAIEVRQSALLQQPHLDLDQPYTYQLQLQLQNKLALPQEWPTLVVSFSDAAAAVMATVAIPPQQYLPASKQGQPFAANSQQAIRVPVSLENKKINGFTVEKYYP